MKAAENLKSLSSFSEEAAAAAAAASSRRKLPYDVFQNITVGRVNEKKEIIDELLKLNSAADFPVSL
ncbi:hypothetical protein A2U01_0032384, partial [Trifolium medium]|nr:hypothetical protein [Trifolium medium]